MALFISPYATDHTDLYTNLSALALTESGPAQKVAVSRQNVPSNPISL